MPVAVTFDSGKREETLRERGLDFAGTAEIFAGDTLTLEDDRRDYGETRYQTYGFLKGRLVMVVWTPRGAVSPRHVRKCNAREKEKIGKQFRQSG